MHEYPYLHVYVLYLYLLTLLCIQFCACHLRWYLHLLFIVHMLRLSMCSA